MEITSSALKYIKQLKLLRREPRSLGVRLGFRENRVYLKWDRPEPKEKDLVIMKRGIPILIDSESYYRLNDHVLDFERSAGRPRFVLHPKYNRQQTNLDSRAANNKSIAGGKTS